MSTWLQSSEILVRQNSDKRHRCPRCHACVVSSARSWRTYNCYMCNVWWFGSRWLGRLGQRMPMSG